MRRDRSRARGFSLIELAAVMSVLGLLAAGTAATLTVLESSQQSAAARAVERDLRYSRERAMTTGRTHWVHFLPAQDRYTLREQPEGTSTFLTSVVLPVSAAAGVTGVSFANEFPGAGLASASFDSGGFVDTIVGFTWRGLPVGASGNSLTSQGVVTIDGGHSVLVDAQSGLVTHVGP